MFEPGEEVLVPGKIINDGKLTAIGSIRVEVVVREENFDSIYVDPAIIIRKPKPPKIEDIQPGDEVTMPMTVHGVKDNALWASFVGGVNKHWIPVSAILSHTPKLVALPVTDDEFFAMDKEMQRRVLAQYREMAKGVTS